MLADGWRFTEGDRLLQLRRTGPWDKFDGEILRLFRVDTFEYCGKRYSVVAPDDLIQLHTPLRCKMFCHSVRVYSPRLLLRVLGADHYINSAFCRRVWFVWCLRNQTYNICGFVGRLIAFDAWSWCTPNSHAARHGRRRNPHTLIQKSRSAYKFSQHEEKWCTVAHHIQAVQYRNRLLESRLKSLTVSESLNTIAQDMKCSSGSSSQCCKRPNTLPMVSSEERWNLSLDRPFPSVWSLCDFSWSDYIMQWHETEIQRNEVVVMTLQTRKVEANLCMFNMEKWQLQEGRVNAPATSLLCLFTTALLSKTKRGTDK